MQDAPLIQISWREMRRRQQKNAWFKGRESPESVFAAVYGCGKGEKGIQLIVRRKFSCPLTKKKEKELEKFGCDPQKERTIFWDS